MPYDITMCKGGECKLRENCLRFTGMVYGRQDYFGSIPFDNASNNCEHYLDDRPKEEQLRKYAYHLWQKEGCSVGDELKYWHMPKKNYWKRSEKVRRLIVFWLGLLI